MNSRSQDDPRTLEDVDEDALRRYPLSGGTRDSDDENRQEEFRDYAQAPDHVREFYRLNHQNQTVELVRQKRQRYLKLGQKEMGIWEAMEFLNQLTDESDPDTGLSQIQHLLQTSEAIRADGHPDWFILTGLIHDLGKILCLFGEPQWSVTGDTFPVGCRFDESIVYHDFFSLNPDAQRPEYQTECGIYTPGCGLRNVLLSWGHDEYMYHVARDYLPESGLAMIRYHSFYSWHREGGYEFLMDEQDHRSREWVRAFNPYDLYSKSDDPPDVEKLKPFYQELISRYFPPVIRW